MLFVNKASLNKFIQHPDKDELISKLIEGTSPKELHEWLEGKYISNAEKKFVLSESLLAGFKEKHLDFYVTIRNDVLSTKDNNVATANHLDKVVQSSLTKNKAYKEKIVELASKEVDIKNTIRNLVAKIEYRLEQVFDSIQENNDMDDFKDDNTLIKYLELLMNAAEKMNKIVNDAPDQVIQHQHTIQIADQQIQIILDTIKDILSNIDYDASLYFIEQYTERIGALKAPEEYRPAGTEVRLAEVKMLETNLDKKL